MTLSRRLFFSSLAAGLATPARAADLDVVIVGAGVAGLAAARTLMAARKNVLVLEARERIGGRAVTDSTTFGFPFDQDAQWIEAGNAGADDGHVGIARKRSGGIGSPLGGGGSGNAQTCCGQKETAA